MYCRTTKQSDEFVQVPSESATCENVHIRAILHEPKEEVEVLQKVVAAAERGVPDREYPRRVQAELTLSIVANVRVTGCSIDFCEGPSPR